MISSRSATCVLVISEGSNPSNCSAMIVLSSGRSILGFVLTVGRIDGKSLNAALGPSVGANVTSIEGSELRLGVDDS